MQPCKPDSCSRPEPSPRRSSRSSIAHPGCARPATVALTRRARGAHTVSSVTATHTGKWLDFEPTGEKLEWRNAIFFPWDPVARKFKGEMVYTDLVMPSRDAA